MKIKNQLEQESGHDMKTGARIMLGACRHVTNIGVQIPRILS